MNIDSKTHIETGNYSWKLHLNEYIEIRALMKTEDNPTNILVEVEWEVWVKKNMVENSDNMVEYILCVLRRECNNMTSFFEFRKLLQNNIYNDNRSNKDKN